MVNYFRHLCAQCVMLLVAPGPRAQGCSWPRSGPSDSRHLGSAPPTQRATDTNQVMKNRSGPAIIQSSSLIRFLGPVICEPWLKPSPCVFSCENLGSLSSLIVHLVCFQARCWSALQSPSTPVLSRSEITLTASTRRSTISIFIHFSSQPEHFWLF